MNISFRKLKVFTIFLIIITTASPAVKGQNSNYLGNEPDINKEFLLSKAINTDVNNGISEVIWQDEKNSYYCIMLSKLSTKFEKIRVLELCFNDNTVVNIGQDDQFLYFLVNNTLDIDSKTINATFNNFHKQALEEKENMNEEQMRLWLIQHDKESK